MEEKKGYVYIVDAIYFKHNKIGYWTGKLSGLKSRYNSTYGHELKIYTYYNETPKEFENKFKKEFKKYHISHELYDSNYINEYQIFFKNITPLNSEELIDKNYKINKIEYIYDNKLKVDSSTIIKTDSKKL